MHANKNFTVQNTSFNKMGDLYDISLSLEQYGAVFASNLEQLRKADHFCDVTLVGNDKMQVEAHKVILASHSPIFMEMFTNNKHPHPRIHLSDMGSKQLMYILDYIYSGEVQVHDTDVDIFLKAARKLKINGLSTKEENHEIILQKPSMSESEKKMAQHPDLENVKEALEEIGNFKERNCKVVECNKFFPSIEKLVKHLLEGHLLVDTTCLFCKKKFPNFNGRRVHYYRCKLIKQKMDEWFK